jgi:hypothetical protein
MNETPAYIGQYGAQSYIRYCSFATLCRCEKLPFVCSYLLANKTIEQEVCPCVIVQQTQIQYTAT